MMPTPRGRRPLPVMQGGSWSKVLYGALGTLMGLTEHSELGPLGLQRPGDAGEARDVIRWAEDAAPGGGALRCSPLKHDS